MHKYTSQGMNENAKWRKRILSSLGKMEVNNEKKKSQKSSHTGLIIVNIVIFLNYIVLYAT